MQDTQGKLRMPLCSDHASLKTLTWLLFACLSTGCAEEGTAGSGAATAAALTSAAAAGQDENAVNDEEKPYEVDCNQVNEDGEKVCIVDKATYVGWRTFHSTCHVCHGQDAVGTTLAPSLLKDIPKDVFFNTVRNGRTGQIGVMPAWGKNPNVKDFIDDLWSYQRARADGVLKPGRPERRKDE